MRRRTRGALVLIVAIVGAATAGYVASTRIVSPAQRAAETAAPEPSPIVVPVERTQIRNDIITRGTIRFENPMVIIPAGVALDGVKPVVTMIPAVGGTIGEGEVLYELAGRPTFALRGDLPLFRTVRRGDSGQDIAQLQRALERVGFDPGPIDGIYGPRTEAAVVAFYRSRGYDPLAPSPEQEAAAREAENAYADVRDQVHSLEEDARRSATELEEAAAALELAKQRLGQAEAGTHPDTGLPPTPDELAQLRSEVDTAQSRVGAATAANETAQRALAASRRQLTTARLTLELTRRELGHPVPDTEFHFFPSLPVRVDAVSAGRGDVLEGELMRVSEPRLIIESSVDADDADLVSVGMPVTIDLDRIGLAATGTITAKDSTPGTHDLDPDRVYIEISPDDIAGELNGTNVRITIPVAARASSGEVLAVPAAALTATGTGETVVTVVEDDGTTRTVVVEPGLSTPAGLVQVTPAEGDLTEGDWVVVGVERG